jgi:hypothetical protein
MRFRLKVLYFNFLDFDLLLLNERSFSANERALHFYLILRFFNLFYTILYDLD